MCALIKLGALVTQISGKVGGQSFATGPSGSYLKNIGNYINKRTPARIGANIDLQRVTSSWRELTDAQRAGWNSASANFPYVNRLGETKFYSGFNLWGKFSGNLKAIGAPIQDNAPTPISMVLPTTLNLNFTTSQLNAGWTNVFTTERYMLFLSKAQSSGRTSANLNYKLFGVFTSTQVGAVTNVFNDYVAKYGTPLPGQKIFVRVKTVNYDTGIDGGVFLEGVGTVV